MTIHTTDHATRHTDGSDDIQDASNSQKGLATSAQIVDVEANTTHRSSDGKDHSDVVLNNAKVTNIPADDVTLEDVSGNNPASAGLTTTQVSATWGDDTNQISSLTVGSYADDAVGAIINSADSEGLQQVYLATTTDNTDATAGDYYFTSNETGMVLTTPSAQVVQAAGNIDFVEEGSITTAIGTEYVYKATIVASNTTLITIQDGSSGSVTPFYARFWDGDPAQSAEIRAKDGGITEAKLATALANKVNGATQNADTDLTGNGYFLDDDTFSADDATKVASQQSIKAYVGSKVASSVEYKGAYDASAAGPSGSATKGDMYTVTVAGNGGGFWTARSLEVGDVIIAEVDNPASDADWTAVQKDMDAASIKVSYESNADTNAFTNSEQTKLGTVDTNADVTGDNAPQAHAASHTDGTDDIQDASASQKGLVTNAAQTIAGQKTFTTPVRLSTLNTGDSILTTDSDGDVQESGVKALSAPAGGSGVTVAEYASAPTAPPTGFIWIEAVDANTKALKYYNGTDTFSVDLGKE